MPSATARYGATGQFSVGRVITKVVRGIVYITGFVVLAARCFGLPYAIAVLSKSNEGGQSGVRRIKAKQLTMDSESSWPRVLRLTIAWMCYNHIVACLWMCYGLFAGFGSDSGWGPSVQLAQSTFGAQYTTAMYWAFHSTVSEPSNSPTTQVQMMMTIVVYMFGTAVSSIYIGVIGSHIVNRNLDPVGQLKKSRLQSIAYYMEYLRLPDSLQDRYLIPHRQWERGHGLGSDEFFNDLPTSLRNAVIFFINGEAREGAVPQTCPEQLVFELVTHLKPLSVPEGVVVINVGDRGDCMYLIASVRATRCIASASIGSIALCSFVLFC